MHRQRTGRMPESGHCGGAGPCQGQKVAQEPGEAVVADTPAAAPQPDSAADTDPKKAAIAAAIARAKAKKLPARKVMKRLRIAL